MSKSNLSKYLDASCNENNPNLSSYLMPCFLVPINVKRGKLMTMEAQTLHDHGTLTCFIDKELVRQYKLGPVEKNTLMPVEVINGQSLHGNQSHIKTKALDVTGSFHTSKLVFNVNSFPRN
jgi:hypothetical protein